MKHGAGKLGKAAAPTARAGSPPARQIFPCARQEKAVRSSWLACPAARFVAETMLRQSVAAPIHNSIQGQAAGMTALLNKKSSFPVFTLPSFVAIGGWQFFPASLECERL
ncbi:MAG: hypothetical protein KGM15_10530 [Pseudomonadota bacterium]|nr:hypothetical protein [Pseudomonadota bacterium]